MDPNRKRELKRQAFMRLAAQRRRAGLLRRRVVVLSLVCFAVLWSAVFVQMATGNDPVLSAKEKAVATKAGDRRSRRAQRTETRPRRRAAQAEGAATEVEEVAPEAEVEEVAPEEEPEVVETEPLVTSQS